MDLSKYSKPLHFTCPKCHADFEFNGNKAAREKAELSREIEIIKAKMQTHRNQYGKDGYYRKLVKQLQDKNARYSEVRQLVQMGSETGELQKYALFKKKCKQRFGEEVINELLNECEEELSYRIYDMAIQDHTNFENA